MDNFYKNTLKAREILVQNNEKLKFKTIKKSKHNKENEKSPSKSTLAPETAQLLKDMFEDIEKCSKDTHVNDNEEYKFDERLVSCSIQAVCGKNTYSNDSLQKFWTNLTNKTEAAASDNKNTIGQLSKAENSDGRAKTEDEVLKKSGLSRNSAIRGLLKKNLISVDDIQIPNESKTSLSNVEENAKSTKYLSFLPHPEDSDVYVRPLQVYEKLEEQFKDIDFTVNHVGKRMVTTPRQFHLAADDDCFKFVKNS